MSAAFTGIVGIQASVARDRAHVVVRFDDPAADLTVELDVTRNAAVDTATLTGSPDLDWTQTATLMPAGPGDVRMDGIGRNIGDSGFLKNAGSRARRA